MADDGDELARRLESFRNYLLLLARVQLDGRLRGQLDPEDLVQQTLTRALEKRDRFRGCDDAQRAAWLRTLLRHTLIDAARKFARGGGVARSLEAAIERRSSARFEEGCSTGGYDEQTSPGKAAAVGSSGTSGSCGWPTPWPPFPATSGGRSS